MGWYTRRIGDNDVTRMVGGWLYTRNELKRTIWEPEPIDGIWTRVYNICFRMLEIELEQLLHLDGLM